jgi:hypothetical protein
MNMHGGVDEILNIRTFNIIVADKEWSSILGVGWLLKLLTVNHLDVTKCQSGSRNWIDCLEHLVQDSHQTFVNTMNLGIQ